MITLAIVGMVAFICLVFAWVAYASLKEANEMRRLEGEQRQLSEALKQAIKAEQQSKEKILAAAAEIRKQRDEANHRLSPAGIASAIRHELHANQDDHRNSAGSKNDAVPAASDSPGGDLARSQR